MFRMITPHWDYPITIPNCKPSHEHFTCLQSSEEIDITGQCNENTKILLVTEQNKYWIFEAETSVF